MAVTTKNREDEQTDDLNNPAKSLADQEFNALTHPDHFNKNADSSQEDRNIDKLRNAESEGGAGPERRSLNDSAAGKAAVEAASTAASAAATPVAGAVIKALGKIKTRKGGIGSMIALLIVSIFVLIATFAGPGLLLVQVKETLNDKYNDMFAALDERSVIIIKKKLKATNGICRNNIKVLCRFDGFSKKQIAAFEKAEWKVNTNGKTISGKTRVTSLELPDGTKVTAANLDSVLANNLEARRTFARAFNPRYMAYASKVFDGLRIKLKLTKQKNIAGTTKEELDSRMKNTLAGLDANGQDLGRIKTTTDPDGTIRDQYGNALSEADLKQLEEFNSQIDNTAKKLAEAGEGMTFSLAKSGLLATATAGIGAIDTLCTGYSYLQLIGFGAKVLVAQQLIRFAFVFLNTGDLIKAGDATQEIVGYVGKKATDLNQFGQSFTDAFYYQYAAFGDLRFPQGSTDGETADMRNAITRYAVGDGISGLLTDIIGWINYLSGDNADDVCRSVKSFWGQLSLIALGVGMTIFSGGANLGFGAFVFGSVGAVISIAFAMFVPKITSMVAGTVVTTNTKGGDAGNAATVGMAQLNAQNSAAHGLSPLTKDRVLEYTNKTRRTAAKYDAAERAAANPFDITNPVTPAYAVATAVNMQFNSPATFVKSPLKLFENAASSLFSPIVRAADDPLAEYKICDDKIYNDKNYAADPTCSIRFGLSNRELGFDPETVTLWMYDNNFVDDNGDPNDGTEYADYVAECMNRPLPLGSTGEDSEIGDGAICSSQETKHQYFRMFFFDNSVAHTMDEENTSADPPAATTPPPSTTPSASGWVWPLHGVDRGDVDNPWGNSTSRGIHKAIDIGAKVGTPVYAAHDGVVSSKSFDSWTCGRMYLIKATGTSPQVWMTYQHLTRGGTRLADNATVRANQQIGTVGTAGGTTCGSWGYYHLHFGIELTEHISTYGDPLRLSTDPLKYLP